MPGPRAARLGGATPEYGVISAVPMLQRSAESDTLRLEWIGRHDSVPPYNPAMGGTKNTKLATVHPLNLVNHRPAPVRPCVLAEPTGAAQGRGACAIPL